MKVECGNHLGQELLFLLSLNVLPSFEAYYVGLRNELPARLFGTNFREIFGTKFFLEQVRGWGLLQRVHKS